jgi:hypothetical protein
MMVGMSILLFAVFVSAATITIDGDMSDWTSAMQVDVDPGSVEEVGDLTDAGTVVEYEIDIRDVYITNDATNLYIRVDVNEDADLTAIGDVPGNQQIFIDTDMSNETGLTWGYMAGGYDIYVYSALESADSVGLTSDNGATWDNIACNVVSALNADANGWEISINLADLGLDALPSCSIMLINENTSNWGNDHFPNDLGATTMDYFFSSTKTIDGDMSDWAAYEMMDVDSLAEEVGDNLGIPALDIRNVYMAYDDDYVYVRIDVDENALFSEIPDANAEGGGQMSVFWDTDNDQSTGLTWGGWFAAGGDYYNKPLEADDILQKDTGESGDEEFFEDVGTGYASAINGDENSVEFAMPRVDLGETGTFYEYLNIFVFDEEFVNWDVEDAWPSDFEDGRIALYSFGAGAGTRVNPVAIDTELDSNMPTEFAVVGNYPNPFNPSTTIRFTLGEATNVTLDVYNMLGQKVATLYNGLGHTGANEVTWNGTNDNNQSVDSGVYLYRVTTPTGVASGKMIMLK